MYHKGCEFLQAIEGKWEKSLDCLLAQRDLSENKMNVKDQLMMKWSKRCLSMYCPLSILKQITFKIEIFSIIFKCRLSNYFFIKMVHLTKLLKWCLKLIINTNGLRFFFNHYNLFFFSVCELLINLRSNWNFIKLSSYNLVIFWCNAQRNVFFAKASK